MLLFILPQVFLYQSCQYPVDCAIYKNGKFKMHSPSQNADYIIVRNDSIQTEINVKTNVVLTERIIWKSPCQYDLQELSTSNPHLDFVDSFFLNHAIHVHIIETAKNYYISSTEIQIGKKKVFIMDTLEAIQ